LFNYLKKKIKQEKHDKNLWEYTWSSVATAKKKKYKKFIPIPCAEALIKNIITYLDKDIHIKVNHVNSGGASYKLLYAGKNNSIKIDWINIPMTNRFKERKYYYKTYLHELSHCIMERLEISQRIDLIDDEESVAELSSMIMCILLGIDIWDESYRYLSDYMTNTEGYMILDGRLSYILKYTIAVVECILKMHRSF
jgi:hypothetical protein